MTGRAVARKLIILLPLIVMFFGLPSIGLASANPLVKCDFEGSTPFVCSGATTTGGNITTQNPLIGLASNLSSDSENLYHEVNFNSPLNVETNGFSVAVKVKDTGSWTQFRYLKLYFNDSSSINLYQTFPWSDGEGPLWEDYSGNSKYLIINITPTTYSSFGDNVPWDTISGHMYGNGSFSYVDFSTRKPSKITWIRQNWSMIFDDFQVYDHILTESERQQLVETGNITPPAPECVSYTYSSWSDCSSGQQTRSVVSSVPSECSGGVQPSLTQACLDETATSTISSEWNNFNSSQSWVDLTGTCSPSDTNTLVYVYQSNTTDLPSDHYNSVGIQMGISSSLFQTYAEPCSSEGTWHRIVFLSTGDNYFTTYTRTQSYSTSWTAKNPSNTVKVLYGSSFDYHITWPSGSDSLIGQYPLRTLDKKSFYDTGQEFSFIGYFDNGSLLGEQASFRVDEVTSTGSVITSDIYSGSVSESYKTACENYPRGCLYALKIPYSSISAGNGTRYFKILFSNDNNWSVIFDIQYLALTLTDNSSDPDIDWGLPIDDNWSTTTQPYIPDEDFTNASLDTLFLKFSKVNICGQKPDEITGILSAVKSIPYAICGFGHELFFPSKAALNYLFTLDGVLKDSFPWSIPFVFFDSLDEKLDSASYSYNNYSIPLKFLIAGQEVTVDVTDYFHDTLIVVGSVQLGWVFNGITLRVFLGNLLAFVVFSLIFILMFSFPDRLE